MGGIGGGTGGRFGPVGGVGSFLVMVELLGGLRGQHVQRGHLVEQLLGGVTDQHREQPVGACALIGGDRGAVDDRLIPAYLVAGAVDHVGAGVELGVGVTLDGELRVEVGLRAEGLLVELLGLVRQVDHLLDGVSGRRG